MSKFLKRFADDESGATAIEYGLIAAGIAVAIIAAVNLLGDTLQETFEDVESQIRSD
jgi:pilus assembly protein Flp/PilA